MKSRTTAQRKQTDTELKGVVKRMAGRLTNNPAMEKEGDAEMREGESPKRKRGGDNPDPHRRG